MIKFRAWDKENDEMLFPDDTDKVAFIIEADGIVTYDMRYPGDEYSGLAYLDTILMQYTGFKDNNDTEIFEGDVINVHWFYADFDPVELGAFENEEYAERVVVAKEFGNLGFWWKEADSWVDLATLAMSARLDEESFEILGNIYENPELLSSGID